MSFCLYLYLSIISLTFYRSITSLTSPLSLTSPITESLLLTMLEYLKFYLRGQRTHCLCIYMYSSHLSICLLFVTLSFSFSSSCMSIIFIIFTFQEPMIWVLSLKGFQTMTGRSHTLSSSSPLSHLSLTSLTSPTNHNRILITCRDFFVKLISQVCVFVCLLILYLCLCSCVLVCVCVCGSPYIN